MATRKRRHAGVTLIPPKHDGRSAWRARYRDPDEERQKWVTLPAHVRTQAEREDFAVRLSEKLSRRREELERGAPRATGMSLADAIERFYTGHEAELRGRTHETYRLGTDRLLRWAADNSARTTDDLTRPKLMAFRVSVVAAPRQYSEVGVKQGGKTSNGERRSAATINKELRATKRVLGYLIDLDMFSRLQFDDLRRALKPVQEVTERKDFLRGPQLRKLLEACERHDADVYAMTRQEKDAGLAKGNTPRHEPISAFVLFVLLTGMRLSEAIDLQWKNVDLDGHEVRLPGSTNKTKRGRTVDLEVSPALRKLLVAQRLKTGGKGSVWNISKDSAIKSMRRLRKTYGAPAVFNYQALRRTCGTFLTCSPSIYGAASAFLSAKQLGHSVLVAEKNYVGALRKIPADAKDLEHAMKIDGLVGEVIDRVAVRRAA